MSYIGEQPHGDFKDWLIKVRKKLDASDHDFAGDELDLTMRRWHENMVVAHDCGAEPRAVAKAILNSQQGGD